MTGGMHNRMMGGPSNSKAPNLGQQQGQSTSNKHNVSGWVPACAAAMHILFCSDQLTSSNL